MWVLIFNQSLFINLVIKGHTMIEINIILILLFLISDQVKIPS
jgi:hypothetical protein